tara:strand:- start:896 stop:2062 length:1167 start_codon:yes stop_codon:yes gene_type:complete
MKICMLNPFSKFAAVRQFNLAKALATQGNQVTLILPKFDKYSGYEKVNIEKVKNLKIIHPFQIKSKILELSMAFYIPSAIKKALKDKYDIVHGFRPTPFSGYIGYKIAKKQKIPFILEMGDIEWESMKELKIHPSYRVKIVKWLEKKLINKADGVTTMSPSLGKYFEKKYNKRVIAIPSGIDINKFSRQNINPQLRRVFQNKTKQQNNMIYVGKLDKANHIVDIIKVLKKINNVGLVIVGEGKGKNDLINLAKKLNVKNRCYFVGRLQHEEIPQYLNTADILVAPFSKSMIGSEFTLNLKILEYMGMEKPIVISGIGILKEILKDCAFIYEPSNLDSFATQIKKVINNKELAKKTAKNARDKILDYDWNKLAQKMLNYYKDINKKTQN